MSEETQKLDRKWQVSVEAQLARILASVQFNRASRLSRFLTFLVEIEAAGMPDRANQYDIASEVFGRGLDFNPLTDAIVRVEARRLRSKLVEYYADETNPVEVLISLPKGGYRLRIQRARNVTGQAGDTVKPPGVAVLPFRFVGSDGDLEYIADGIVEDLISELSEVAAISVASRQSSFVYRDSTARVSEIAEDLGVSYLVEGSLQGQGDDLRLSVGLVETDTDRQVWSTRTSSRKSKIFADQVELVQGLVESMRVSFSQHTVGGAQGFDWRARDLLHRAQSQFYAFTAPGRDKALGLLDEALLREPAFPGLSAWKARVLISSAISDTDAVRPERIRHAVEVAETAVRLAPGAGLTHSMLGWATLWARDYDRALAETARGVDLAPGSADTHLWRAFALAASGDGPSALHAMTRAAELNPHFSVTYLNAFAVTYFALGRYQDASLAARRGMAQNPNFLSNHLLAAASLGICGQIGEAAEATKNLETADPQRKLLSYDFYAEGPVARAFSQGLAAVGLSR